MFHTLHWIWFTLTFILTTQGQYLTMSIGQDEIYTLEQSKNVSINLVIWNWEPSINNTTNISQMQDDDTQPLKIVLMKEGASPRWKIHINTTTLGMNSTHHVQLLINATEVKPITGKKIKEDTIVTAELCQCSNGWLIAAVILILVLLALSVNITYKVQHFKDSLISNQCKNSVWYVPHESTQTSEVYNKPRASTVFHFHKTDDKPMSVESVQNPSYAPIRKYSTPEARECLPLPLPPPPPPFRRGTNESVISVYGSSQEKSHSMTNLCDSDYDNPYEMRMTPHENGDNVEENDYDYIDLNSLHISENKKMLMVGEESKMSSHESENSLYEALQTKGSTINPPQNFEDTRIHFTNDLETVKHTHNSKASEAPVQDMHAYTYPKNNEEMDVKNV